MDTKNIIDQIYKVTSKKKDMFTKANVYRYVAKELNDIADGSWTYPYIANLHSGKQLDSMSIQIKYAIKVLHKRLVKPPKVLKDYRLRPVQCLCTEAEYKEMLKLGTRERTTIMLNGYSF